MRIIHLFDLHITEYGIPIGGNNTLENLVSLPKISISDGVVSLVPF